MTPPENTKVVETDLARLWIDNAGILSSSIKKDVTATIDNIKEFYSSINYLTNGNKVCFINDISNTSGPDKPSRDYLAKQAEYHFRAVALITKSKLAVIIGNTMISLYKYPFPARLFTDENKAKEWIKNYL